MLDNILLYNTLGYATFPAKAKDKTPAVKNWVDRVPDPLGCLCETDLYKKAGAFGVVLQDDDLIIDIDPRNWKDGVNPWKSLREDLALGKVDAPVVVTGGGGLHIYFKKPADLKVVGKIGGYEGLDIKAGAGAYVVGPGSQHESGQDYKFLESAMSLDKVYEAPEALLEFLIRKEPILKEGAGLVGGAQELARYETWLQTTALVELNARGGDAQRFRIACVGRDYGLKPEDTLKAMADHYNSKCEPAWGEEKLKLCVFNAYKYATGEAGTEDPSLAFEVVDSDVDWDDEGDEHRKWDMTKDGDVKKSLRNAINYLYIRPELAHTIRLNQFTGDIEMTGNVPWADKRVPGSSWSDSDVVLLKYHLAKEAKIEFSTSMLWDALHAAAIRRAYHPIRDYISSVKWDGVPRLDTWLRDYCGAQDNPYTSAVGRKVLTGLVARVFNPGIKFDYCMVLEGAQGIGKSSVCDILGGKWYGDIILDPHARDTIDAMRGKWVIELSEMEVTRRADAQALKAFVSRTSDRARLAYARSALDFPRQCVFIGTINPDELGYLSDSTGNRRFWPVKCGDKMVDFKGLQAARDQLFAEAHAAFKKKEKLFLSGDLLKLAEIEQAERMAADPWEDTISAWLDTTEATELTASQVYTLAIGGSTQSMTRSVQIRIGRALKDLGWMKHRVFRGGGRLHVYTPDYTARDERMKEFV